MTEHPDDLRGLMSFVIADAFGEDEGLESGGAADAVLALLEKRGLKIVEEPDVEHWDWIADRWFDIQPLYPGAPDGDDQ